VIEAGPDRYATVAVPVPVRRTFTYRVGSEHQQAIGPGSRVRVPFGPRRVLGTVVEWPAAEPEVPLEIKPIEAVVRSSRLTEPLLALTRFVADYYLCSWGEAIEAALPPEAGQARARRHVRRAAERDPRELGSRAPARRRLLERLPADPPGLPLDALTAGERRLVPLLGREGWIELCEVELPSTRPAGSTAPHALPPEPAPLPTAAQTRVLERLLPAIDAGRYAPFLLFGETGSGKTEIYFRAAERALAAGRGVLYLVPEIGLTPLLTAKIARRFPGSFAVLHSGLARRERVEAWRAVLDGRARLAVGARSAIFAPVRELGLIVVDEEQDGSYKQEEKPRYNARDLAVVRARGEGAVLLLGSATPSLESFRHARNGRYELLRLGSRIHERPLPAMVFVDMRREYQRSGRVEPLSERLVAELAGTLERGEQALVLRNRRGWSQAVLCLRCGERIGCSRCSVALTWHRSPARLRCHYCALAERLPERCPRCDSQPLKLVGEGTEQIEQLIRAAVPGARVARMDRDTMRGRGEQAELLGRFDRGELDVLVGTQMIAKGHDFHRVTLVGVLAADHALGLPDFRASERVFQLLTQVAGRAGRGVLPGRVVVQAFTPDHPLLRLAASQDFEAFFEREIRYRRALRYPPLAALVLLRVQDRDPGQARAWSETLAAALREAGGDRLLIGGPGPAPIERLKGQWRRQILVRSAGRRRLIATVEQALAAVDGKVPRKAIVVDVDPYTLL
jgi:primosomal protein N' (replication factor Y)